jgi:hypothetical protein
MLGHILYGAPFEIKNVQVMNSVKCSQVANLFIFKSKKNNEIRAICLKIATSTFIILPFFARVL